MNMPVHLPKLSFTILFRPKLKRESYDHDQEHSIDFIFIRSKDWPWAVVVAHVILCVCVLLCVIHEVVHSKIHHPHIQARTIEFAQMIKDTLIIIKITFVLEFIDLDLHGQS